MECLQHFSPSLMHCDGEQLRQVALVRIGENNLPFSYFTQAADEFFILLRKFTFIIQSNFILQLGRGGLLKV